MKEIISYQCESCMTIHEDKNEIYKCSKCGTEFCNKCEGYIHKGLHSTKEIPLCGYCDYMEYGL